MRRNRKPMMLLVALAVPAVLMAANVMWIGHRNDAAPAVVAYERRTTGVVRAESEPLPAGLYYTYRHPDYHAYRQCGRSYCVPALRGDHYPPKPDNGVVVLGSGRVEGPINLQGKQVYR